MAHPRTLSAAVLPAAVILLTTCGHDVTAPPAPTQLVFIVQPRNIVAGHEFSQAVQVQAEDAHGNKVASFVGNVTVALATNPGGSTLHGTTTAGAVDGIAAFNNLSLDKTGTGYTLTASASGGGLAVPTSAAFDVAPGPATQLEFSVEPATAIAGAVLAPAAQVTALDAAGNPVPGFTGKVTVALGNPGASPLGGTTTVAAVNGVATFGDLTVSKAGTGYWLTGSSTGLARAASSAFEVTAGAATQLVFGTQPGTTVADHNITPAVKVRALDALGNLVPSFTGSVSIVTGTNPGGATLSGTTPVAAIGGVATFYDLSLNKTGTGYTLTASGNGFPPVTSTPFDITPGTATQLAFTAQPGNTVAGAMISPAVQVTALDPAGNAVPGFTGSVTVAFGSNPGGSTLSGTTTVTAVNGVASFGDLSANKTGTSYWLTATATGLSRATSSVFGITPGTATQLVFGTQPGTTVANRLITPAVKVRALDAFGNLATGFTDAVGIALGSNPGGATLSGTTPVAAVAGVATFFDLSLNRTGTGYTLTASATGFTTVTSTAFDIIPGTATQLAFTVQPTTTVAGAAISPAVQVTALDPAGNLVPGFTGSITVALGNNPGGSTLGGTATVPASGGVASFSTLTLDKTAPGYRLTASATGLSTATSASFNIIAGGATQLVFGTEPGTTIAGHQISPAVKVRALDALGNLVPGFTANVTVALGNNPGGGTLSGTTQVTAVGGVASFGDLSLNKTGTGFTLTAGAGGFSSVTSTAFDITPGTATQLAFTVQPTATVAGQSIAPAVQVTALDAGGNLVPTFTGNVTVTLGNNPGGSTLGGTTTAGAVNGVATFGNLTLDKTAPGYWLSATSTGLSTATSSSFNVTAGAATQLVFGTEPGTTSAGHQFTPAVKVRALDGLGNLAPTFTGNVSIAFGSNPTGGTLSGTTPVAAVGGVATFADLIINKVGTGYTLVASATGFTPVASTTFDITPGTATQLVFTVQPSNTVAGQQIAPSVQVSALDAGSNPVPSFTGDVTLTLGNNPGGSILGGTTTVAAVGGVATFGTLTLDKTSTGYWLTATATGLSTATSTSFSITAGTATALVFGTQPSTAIAGHQIAPAVKVRALDALGNLATGFTGNVAIAFGSNPGGSTLTGTTPVAAVGGVATFTDLSLNRTAAGYTLTASATGVSAVTSSAFDITPGTATQLLFSQQPTTTVAGQQIAPGVQVTAADAGSNPVPGFTGNVTVTLGNNPGGSTLTGTTTVAAVNGVATFGDLSLNKSGNGYWLTATTTGLSSATSNSFTISASTATQIVFSTQPGTIVAGHQFSPAVKVRTFDAFGNVATGFTSDVTVAVGNNPGGGTLSGTNPVAAVSGTATFFDISINKTGTGYTLSATGGGLGPITSTAFDITPGNATQLVFTQQPTSPVAGQVIAPAVQVTALDPAGNLVPTFSGNVTIGFGNNPGGSTLGGATTVAAVNGVATFSDLTLDKSSNNYWLTATGTGLSTATSNAFNIAAGPATQLVFGTQPSTITGGTSFNPTVKVRALDALGNLATSFTGDVTVALGGNPGGGPLIGTATVAAVGGVATFSVLSVNVAATGYTLTADAGGFAQITSGLFDVLVGPPTHVDFGARPHDEIAGAVIGSPFLQLRVEDAGGNLVTTATNQVSVALGANPGGGTLSGTTTVNAVGGLATFDDLTLDKVGVGYTLVLTSPGLIGQTSDTFTISPAAASQLVFTVQPTSTAAAATITPAVEVTARDAFGNVATGFTGNVTLAIGSNPGGGTLSGTTTVAAVAGVASLTTLSVNNVGVGYTLRAMSGGLTVATSTPFDVN